MLEGFATIHGALRPGFATVASQEVSIDGGSHYMIEQDAVYVMQYGAFLTRP